MRLLLLSFYGLGVRQWLSGVLFSAFHLELRVLFQALMVVGRCRMKALYLGNSHPSRKQLASSRPIEESLF